MIYLYRIVFDNHEDLRIENVDTLQQSDGFILFYDKDDQLIFMANQNKVVLVHKM